MQEFSATAAGDLKLLVASESDVGCVRENNEDSVGSFHGKDPADGHLLVVCDGMGGAAGGEVASHLAVTTLSEVYFATVREHDPRIALQHAIEQANAAIHARSEAEAELGGMGTTCTAAVIVELEVIIGHVGDSRAYLLGDSGLRQLTRDHSLAAELERRVAPGSTAPLAGRNVLTRCLGVSPTVQVDMTPDPLRLAPDGALILCSDGLSNQVNTDEIKDAVSASAPAEACRRLVTLARERGGPDNITVQVARVQRV